MKPLDLPKLPGNKKSIFESKASQTRRKFPKIEKCEKEQKKNKEEEVPKESIFSPQTAQSNEITGPSIELIEALSAANLIEQLSKTMVKKIELAKQKGALQTNFIVQTKHFDEIEVILNLYSTDPYTYHIKILGNQKLQEATLKHQEVLTSQIHKSLPHIRVHVLPPALREKNRYRSNKVQKKKSVEKTTATCYGTERRG